MPNAMLHPCAAPGCSALVKSGYCATHKRVATEPSTDERRKRNRMYWNDAWKRRRISQLSSHPWCEDCLRANIYVPATDVHHVQRHEGDALTFAISPLQSLCHACHSKHTAQEQGSPRGYAPEESFSWGKTSAGGLQREKISPMEVD